LYLMIWLNSKTFINWHQSHIDTIYGYSFDLILSCYQSVIERNLVESHAYGSLICFCFWFWC